MLQVQTEHLCQELLWKYGIVLFIYLLEVQKLNKKKKYIYLSV